MRKIYVIGEIDLENYAKFTQEMTDLELESVEDPINVVLSSHGGVHEASLAFASRIRLSPCEITVSGVGPIYSAAVLILAYGDHRILAQEAWVMVHEESIKSNDSLSNMEAEMKGYRKMEDQAAELLAERTTTSASKWAKLHKDTTYLSPTECLALGLIEEIL